MGADPVTVAETLVNNPPVHKPTDTNPTNPVNPFKPLPLSIEHTHVNINRLAKLLDGYPDQYQVDYILHGLRHGFDIGFKGQILEHVPRNNKSARDNYTKVTLAINKEVTRGHTAGPFAAPPFPINRTSLPLELPLSRMARAGWC